MAMTPQEEARMKAEERYPHHKERIIGIMINPSIDLQRDAFIAGYTADRWIDCKVRMPKSKQPVLFMRYGKYFAGRYSEREECWYSDRFTEGTSVGVTHWQPLPEPPKTNEG